MGIYALIIGGSLVFVTGSALLALRWAMRHGQFRNLEEGALMIFDDDEPVGKMTDHFPVRRKGRRRVA
jgi:nitrogen fixation-related uncharacterized protein